MGFPILAIILVGSLVLQVFVPGFPKETLLIQAGISFGVIGGTIINWLGMVIAAQVGYETVYNSLKVGERFSEQIKKYQTSHFIQYLEKKGNFGLFLVRLIPYAPNDVLSLVSGALMLPRKGYIIVSIITAFPYAFVFAYLGNLGSEIFGRQTVWLINFTVMIGTVGGYIVFRYFIKPRVNTS